MSNAGLMAAAIGVGSLANANDTVQALKAKGAVNLVTINLELYDEFDKKLADDANDIYAYSVDPDDTGKVAAAQTQKEIDTNQSDQANGMMNSLIEDRKQVVGAFGNNLTEVFSSIEPIKELMSFFTGLIAKRL